jgi:hypothetical protein
MMVAELMADRETRNADIKLSLAIRKLMSRVTKGEKKDERSTVHCIVSYFFALPGVEGGDKFEWQTLDGYKSVYDSKEP